MISEERSGPKPALSFPVGLLLRSPKRRLAGLGRKPSSGSVQSSHSDITVRSSEGAGVRQPAKSKIRRHNHRLSTVFHRSSDRRDGPSRDPAEPSGQKSGPGVLKVFGSDICQGTNYKSVLATAESTAAELVKDALDRYCLETEDAGDYVLCDVIGRTGADQQWRRECLRVVGGGERPLLLQALWGPKDGFSRRFEIQRRAGLEGQGLVDRDPETAGLRAQAGTLQPSRSRVASLLVDGSGDAVDVPAIWRSLSDTDVSDPGTKTGTETGTKTGTETDTEGPLLRAEQEETESSDETAQYSVHPPGHAPYFLLLQGYSHSQDLVVYLLSGPSTVLGCCREHSAGEDEERLKVDVLLSAPDVLPRHCCVRRPDPGARTPPGGPGRTPTTLRPLHGAPVTRNGVPLQEEAELSPGDLVGLGRHYLFMFKDPTCEGAPQSPPWMSRLRPRLDSTAPCWSCGSSAAARKTSPPGWTGPDGAEASLSYEPEQEDRVLREILDRADPGGGGSRLAPAFLLALCVRHSARAFGPAPLRRLLLRIAALIQLRTWEKTTELAAVQPETGPCDRQPLGLDQLTAALQPLLLWMSNCIELLHFIQHHVPQLLAWRDGRDLDLDRDRDQDLLDSEMSSTRAACEEAMTVLEDVIMFSFQQCVYYLTKTMYPALPGLLDGNPFSDGGRLRVPDGLGGVLEVLRGALQLLSAFQVHPDVSAQLCAYLFFFINASLFNALMDRGSVPGFYQWSRGVQIRANLDLLMDWTRSVGLSRLASDFFRKLSAAVNLLATPKETLLQASWTSLRTEFSALSPAQLHHLLREYRRGRSHPAGWSPTPEDAEDAGRTADVLETFDSHPPLVLPSSSFQLDLGQPILDPSLFQQLARLQDFIFCQTRSGSGSASGSTSGSEEQVPEGPAERSPSDPARPDPAQPEVCGSPEPDPAQGRGSQGSLSSCEAVLTQKLKSLELQSALPGPDPGYRQSLALDPSCLLTPPNTPQGPEPPGPAQPGAPPLLHRVGGREDRRTADVEDTEQEDRDEVFSVELHRGPHGLGLALVDGTKTALRMSGIFVKSVVPDSPAAGCRRLRTGHRILAVNGVSLVGMEYGHGRELIRSSGDHLKLLVANMGSLGPQGASLVEVQGPSIRKPQKKN